MTSGTRRDLFKEGLQWGGQLRGGLRQLKMATLRRALILLGCPDEESTQVLDTNSQHPHKGPHTFTMSLQRVTISTMPVRFPEHTGMYRGKLPGKQPLIQG